MKHRVLTISPVKHSCTVLIPEPLKGVVSRLDSIAKGHRFLLTLSRIATSFFNTLVLRMVTWLRRLQHTRDVCSEFGSPNSKTCRCAPSQTGRSPCTRTSAKFESRVSRMPSLLTEDTKVRLPHGILPTILRMALRGTENGVNTTVKYLP